LFVTKPYCYFVTELVDIVLLCVSLSISNSKDSIMAKDPEATKAANDDDDDDDDEDKDDSASGDDDDDDAEEQQEEAERQRKFQEMEAKAIDKAKATADAAFRPSPSVLNAATPAPLLLAVDGPSLSTYEGKESVYVGRTVPVAAGAKLNIPIQVTAPGSVVEYAVEMKNYDIGFGITAERDEGVTIVKVCIMYTVYICYVHLLHVLCVRFFGVVGRMLTHSCSFCAHIYIYICAQQEVSRVAAAETPITQKFLVGSVPCLIQFSFENDYSWMREKVVSYKITVTPPSSESLSAGRRRRATVCLKTVEEDLQTADSRLSAATKQKQSLDKEVDKLQKELQEKKKALQVAEKEEVWLTERKSLRLQQIAALKERLEKGWPDEKDVVVVVNKAKNGKK
jgi:hypothetical protein